ncbi:MAG: UDP-N-acetylglucosamine 1-carboxyvinyltransferase [Candidatus Aminicenantes bacterium]|nr:UDP-N-acetylglucosamine 1-carboxyvinyltransferase [Candidatus Aminicenantes bacterium]
MQNIVISIQGRRPLTGDVTVAGAKNAALPDLAAVCLSGEAIEFSNVPQVEDIKVMFAALREIGALGEMRGDLIRVAIPEIRSDEVSQGIVRTTRASILLLGPMLARHGRAKVTLPGGCAIGERKIDFHLQGLQRMGAEIRSEREFLEARCRRLRGIEYSFPARTVTGTENLLMAAVLAEGTTVLHNCALEPEVEDLVVLLRDMGADIAGASDGTWIIRGRTALHGARHRVIPDRIEAGTYLMAGCLAGNEIHVQGVVPEHLGSLLDVLGAMGAAVSVFPQALHVRGGAALAAADLVTAPFPGFPTDLQAQATALLTQAEGVSRVRETIFNDRFHHVRELRRLGADIVVKGDTAVVRGRSPLRGATLRTTDLRASAALVLGALAAEGETVIENSYQLFRGYENLPEKLQKLGADITIRRE